MSEWDFLWGLKGKELEDAMSTGMDQFDRDYLSKSKHLNNENKAINEQHRLALKAEWESLKQLRDSGAITMEDFRMRKRALFPIKKQK